MGVSDTEVSNVHNLGFHNIFQIDLTPSHNTVLKAGISGAEADISLQKAQILRIITNTFCQSCF